VVGKPRRQPRPGFLNKDNAQPMPITSKSASLVRFTWNLKDLPPGSLEMPKPFVLRTANKNEADEAVTIVQASYNLDPAWSGCALYINDTVLPGVIKAMAREPSCLFVLHGNRVIGISAYNSEPEGDGVHLVSGPCVITEYRSRGIGAALLSATLDTLRERGVMKATGKTRPNSPSAKYLYTKFGGKPVAPAPAPAEANVA